MLSTFLNTVSSTAIKKKKVAFERVLATLGFLQKKPCGLFRIEKKKRMKNISFLSLKPLCPTLGFLVQPHKNKKEKKKIKNKH